MVVFGKPLSNAVIPSPSKSDTNMSPILMILSPGFIPAFSAGEFFKISRMVNVLFLNRDIAPIPP